VYPYSKCKPRSSLLKKQAIRNITTETNRPQPLKQQKKKSFLAAQDNKAAEKRRRAAEKEESGDEELEIVTPLALGPELSAQH